MAKILVIVNEWQCNKDCRITECFPTTFSFVPVSFITTGKIGTISPLLR